MSLERLPDETRHSIVDTGEQTLDTLIRSAENTIDFTRFANFRANHLGSMFQPIIEVAHEANSALWYAVKGVDDPFLLNTCQLITRIGRKECRTGLVNSCVKDTREKVANSSTACPPPTSGSEFDWTVSYSLAPIRVSWHVSS